MGTCRALTVERRQVDVDAAAASWGEGGSGGRHRGSPQVKLSPVTRRKSSSGDGSHAESDGLNTEVASSLHKRVSFTGRIRLIGTADRQLQRGSWEQVILVAVAQLLPCGSRLADQEHLKQRADQHGRAVAVGCATRRHTVGWCGSWLSCCCAPKRAVAVRPSIRDCTPCITPMQACRDAA